MGCGKRPDAFGDNSYPGLLIGNFRIFADSGDSESLEIRLIDRDRSGRGEIVRLAFDYIPRLQSSRPRLHTNKKYGRQGSVVRLTPIRKADDDLPDPLNGQ